MEFAKNCLSDGREIWALSGTYTQPMMFGLKGRLPKHESIMTLGDFDDAVNRSGAAKTLPQRGGWWRTGEYGVYPRGCEQDIRKPVGAEVVWIEDGYRYSFEVPDVRNPCDRDIGLRQSSGMLVFALAKLRYNRRKRLVTVASDFDPESDVSVRDVMRPQGWALADGGGYPLRAHPSDITVPGARVARLVRADGFEGAASGWHGSIAMLYASSLEHGRRMIDAASAWRYPAGVAVAREAVDPAER